MKHSTWWRKLAGTAASLSLAASLAGCGAKRCMDKCDYLGDFHPKPLGTMSDPIWREQESQAEASDFVVHEHEFEGNTVRLNHAGEEHVKQIAARAAAVPFPILVEPSSMTAREGTVNEFPVHGNHQLDLQRRELIVAALQRMGVADAGERVVVAPALTPGFEQFEAERAYRAGFSGYGLGGFGGFGGGFGGFGGGIGGFGGF